MRRPVEAEALIEGETMSEEQKRNTAQAVVEHMRDNPGASVLFGAIRQEICDDFRENHLGRYAAEFSGTRPRLQLTHRGGGTITFLLPVRERTLYGPQWTMIVFDSSVGAMQTGQHIKDFRASMIGGLHGSSILIENDEGYYDVPALPGTAAPREEESAV